MLNCSDCGAEKPPEEFYKQSRTGKPRGDCKACTRRKNGEYQRRNRERASEMQRAWRFKKRYGITLADYERLLQSQQGRCAICGGPPRGGDGHRFHVDHCHETGTVRGLLCNPCNRGVGLFADSLERISAAIAYMEAAR